MKNLSIDDFTIFSANNVKAYLKDEQFLHNLDKKSKILSKGRGYVIKIDNFVVRFYQHGGIFRRILGDRFFSFERFLNELKVHNFLFKKGVSVPEPIGVIFFKKFLWYHGIFITRYIQNSIDVVEGILNNSLKNIDEIFFQMGKLTKRIHDLNIIHSDLHIKNFLVKDKVFLIDFDKSYISNKKEDKIREIRRFARSIFKFNYFYNNLIEEKFLKFFLFGYGLNDKEVEYFVKKIKISFFNKISWKLNKPLYI